MLKIAQSAFMLKIGG